MQKQVLALRGGTKRDAFSAVLGEEGAREFQKEYREGGIKAKGGKGKQEATKVSLTREEMAKIKEQAGGDRKKAKELIITAQNSLRKGSGAVIAGATRAADLPSPSPRGHMLRIFGQSDRETIENASREAAVPQALALLNGPVADALLNDVSDFSQHVNSAATNEAKMDTIFLGLLSRFPSAAEREILTSVMTDRAETAKADVVHALLNTGEFLFVK